MTTTIPADKQNVATSLAFLRTELTDLQVYKPHPEGIDGQSATSILSGNSVNEIDRIDTNENPYDLPQELKQELAQLWVESIESNRYPDGSHNSLKAGIGAALGRIDRE
jgi:histidinol-phosphate aminotransferase